MLAASAAFAVSVAAVASAQMTHSVMVGEGGALTYTPSTVTAAIGDIVMFTFEGLNHTATVQPVVAGNPNPQVSYNVETLDPIWFYCGQKNPINHCEQGMVFAINPPATGNTFAAFQANAIALGTAGSAPSSSSSTAAPAGATPPAVAPSLNYTIPPDPSLQVVTATFQWNGAPYTTTYSSYPGSPAPTAGVVPTVFNVTVGLNATLTYTPNVVNANIGDMVQFIFPGGNHTATLTSFDTPCVPALNPDNTRVFDTGYEFVAAGSAPLMQTFTVNTENPLWFGCMQKSPVFHCGAGMVFAINPPASGTHSFAAFQALA
ncbi:hypothetical protein DACRYDRAFT_35845, partial [Dacryopinax primogenitus]